MYETLMYSIRYAFGAGLLRLAVAVAAVLVSLSLVLYASPVFRRWFRNIREQNNWRGQIAGFLEGVFKLLLVFLMTRALITAMLQQSAVFERQHGRITETNRFAVLMKWGSPHEQHELHVWHTKKRIWVTRQLRLDDEKGTVTSESFWKGDDRPVQVVDGRMPAVISVHEEERDVVVEQKSLVSADVEITVRNNPRTLGNANYAGYDDEWKFIYTVANRHTEATDAHMRFNLPAETGMFDEMYLRLNGKDALDQAKSEENSVVWTIPMSPDSRCTVEIGYKSRGLEHLRYIPKRMSQTGHYRVTMTIHGIPPDKLDYPIGSMPPAEKLSDIKSSSYSLTWKMDNALTSYDIGIKLPRAEQPAYHFANLLEEAPVGLILLLLLLVLPRMVMGVAVRPGMIGIMGVAYYLLYTFMGRLADLMTGFVSPFAIATGVLTVLAVWFGLKYKERTILGVQDSISFGALAILYPLAVVDTDRTAFWMQIFYVGILIYVAMLVVRFRVVAAVGRGRD